MFFVWMTANAALFEPISTLSTGDWSNKVVLDDVDGDGDLDIVFATGGDYNQPGTPSPNRVFLNSGAGFDEVALPGPPDLSRSVKVADVDRDGIPDLFVSTVYTSPSRMYRGDGGGGWIERPDTLPTTSHSFGDAEFGDVDDDGDLDLVLADWGEGNPLGNAGGRTRLWRNDDGVFVDITDAAMPDRLIGMSWDLELADVDGDFDLDVLISSKLSPSSSLFLNDGAGGFTDASDQLPAFTNNYEFAPMDVDGDGDLDLVTVNDGNNLKEHLLLNDGSGRFENGNGSAWPGSENLGEDDNVVEFADFDGDGDPDFAIGSLSGPDRVLVNDGGEFSLSEVDLFGGPFTPGTLSMAFGDLDGDGRLDAVMAQGEVSSEDRVYLGEEVAVDTWGPVIAVESVQGLPMVVHARVHDRMTPVRSSDLQVELRLGTADSMTPVPMEWMGGQLWRAEVEVEASTVELCATDRAGNTSCETVFSSEDPMDTGPSEDQDPTGCGCASASPGWAVWGSLIRRR